jgi:hypothetical protein
LRLLAYIAFVLFALLAEAQAITTPIVYLEKAMAWPEIVVLLVACFKLMAAVVEPQQREALEGVALLFLVALAAVTEVMEELGTALLLLVVAALRDILDLAVMEGLQLTREAPGQEAVAAAVVLGL